MIVHSKMDNFLLETCKSIILLANTFLLALVINVCYLLSAHYVLILTNNDVTFAQKNMKMIVFIVAK